MSEMVRNRTFLRISALVLLWSIISSLLLQHFLPSLPPPHPQVPHPPPTDPLPVFRRFPSYDSPSFAETCPWALPITHYRDCTIYARPSWRTGEGIAQWLAQVTSGFLLAQQGQCHFYVDYRDVDIRQVLVPASTNWTPPEDLTVWSCFWSRTCFNLAESAGQIQQDMVRLQATVQKSLVPVPYYRHYYERILDASRERELQEVLLGFRLEHGMACALAALFRVVDPLPSTPENAFVISLYIRTGYTDLMVKDPDTPDVLRASVVQTYARCTQQVEQELLRSHHDRIVWQVISDTPSIKNQLQTEFDAQVVHHQDRTLTRHVLQSPALGKHTRARIGPSTQDFAEAVRDWFWIGDADAVVATAAYTFGKMAARRTARVFYNVHQCAVLVPSFQRE